MSFRNTKRIFKPLIALVLTLLTVVGAVPLDVQAASMLPRTPSSLLTTEPRPPEHEPFVAIIDGEETVVPANGIIMVSFEGFDKPVPVEIPRYIYLDEERIYLDDERVENVSPVMPAIEPFGSDGAEEPQPSFIVALSLPAGTVWQHYFSDYQFAGLQVAMNGTSVSVRRYVVRINGIDYEAYCANPNQRGPENPDAMYVMTGNEAAEFLTVLRYGHPNNPGFSDTSLPLDARRWNSYMTRVAVAQVGNAGATWNHTNGNPLSASTAAMLDSLRAGTAGGAPASLTNNPALTVNGQASDHVTGNTPQSPPFDVYGSRRSNCGSNPFRFVWDAGTPAGTQLFADGVLVATAPTNSDQIYFVRPGNPTSVDRPWIRVDEIHFVMPVGSEGQTAAVDLVGINNLYANRVYVMQNSVNPAQWQDIVFYVPEMLARAEYSFGDDAPERGRLRILKTDLQGNNLGGAVFNITGPQWPSGHNVTVGANGWTSGDITIGIYNITEITPPSGFSLASNPTQTVTVTPNHTATAPAIVTFSNEPTTNGNGEYENGNGNGVVIQKIDAITRENIPGALMRLQGMSNFAVNIEGSVYGGPSIINFDNTGINLSQVLTAGATTNIGGGVTSTVRDGVWEIQGLPYGFYQVQEERAPAGYSLYPQHTSYSFWKTPPDITIALRAVSAENGSVVVIPWDEVMEMLNDLSDAVTPAMTLQEVLAIMYDVLNAVQLEVIPVFDVNQTGHKSAINIVFENYPFSEVIIYKREVSNGVGNNQLLQGATFRIQGFYPGNPAIPIDRQATTDSSGRVVFSDLPAGAFTITEISPPSGFLLGENNVWHVNLGWGQTVEAGTAPSHTFFNIPKSSLEILKIDGITNEPLAGAIFELLDPTTGETWQATSGADGIAVFGRGSYGNFLYPNRTYVIREIVAPDGYVLMDGPREIVLSPGDENRITWRNWRNPGLTIIKEDQDTGERLAGAHFTIEAQGSGRPLPTDFSMITDANGEIHIPWTLFEGIAERNFIVTETVAPPGFHLSDPNWQLVTMQAGYNNTVVFSNRRMPDLTILKRDARTGDPIQNAEFSIERLSPAPTGMLTGNPFRTDAQGRIVLTELPAGVYRIIETRAATNYWLDPQVANRTWTITIRENEDYTLIVENTLLPTLIITKFNQVTFRPVPLTRFLVEFEVPNSGNVIRIGEFVTDANGQIILPFVQSGWYRITETHPAPGMSLNVNNSYRVFLHPGDNTYQLLALMPDLRNTPTTEGAPPSQVTPPQGVGTEYDLPNNWENMSDSERAAFASSGLQVTGGGAHLTGTGIWNWPLNSIVIKKTCSVTGNLLQGASFEVIHTSAGVSGTLGTVIGRYTTDNSGIIVLTGLIPGSYVVREVQAPNNFTLNATNTQTVFLQPDGHSVVEVVFANDPYGSLLISKRCEVTGRPLLGAEFRVTTSSGTVVGTANGLFTTNLQGEILIPNLPPDSYIVTETRAPSGFVLNSTPQTIRVEATGETYRLEFTNRPEGTLIIRKLDSFDDSPLAGAIFEVRRQNGTLIGEFRTDASGTIEIPGLLGWVVVEEIQAPPGHELDPNALRTVEIQPGVPTVLTFRNPRQGSITINKVDNEGNPLAGARFRVSRQNGEVIGEFTTAASGMVNVPNLTSGWHLVEEIQAPRGFIMAQGGQSVEVRPNSAQTVTFVNYRMPSLIIEKVDDQGRPLAGAEFEVRTLGGNLVARVTSNSGGIATIEEISPGSFVVTEVRSPQGFVLDSNSQTFEIRAGETTTLRFVNVPYAQTSIRKISGDYGRPLAGVVFEITRLNGERIQNPANRTFEFVTDGSGMIHIPNLASGTYVATEIRALPGYRLADPVTFDVVDGRDTVITIRNYKQPSIVVRKIDGDTGRPLPGVIFEFARYFGNGSTGQRLKNYALDNSYEFTTDASGHIYLPTLEDGQWIAIETRPLPGFMAASPTIFTVGINGDTTVIIRNYRYPDFTILKLDGATRQPLAGVHFEIAHDIGNGTAGQRLVNPVDGTTTFITDNAGRIPLPAIALGRYIAIETRALPGYTIEGPVLFTVAPGENRTVTIYNHKRADWVIRKTDGDTGGPLEGVQFEIARYFGNGNAGERLQNPVDGSTIFTTDRAGLIQLPNLTPGTFIAIETRALPGFVIAEPVIFVVAADSQNTTIDIQNFRLPELTLRKINSVTRESIEGVVFQISRPSGERIRNPQTGFYDFITDRNGLIHLPVMEDGTYLLTEIRAAEGFIGLSEPVMFEINSASRQRQHLLEVENDPASGLLIIKRDASTGQPLQGVEFEVRHADGRIVRGMAADQNQPNTGANSPNLAVNGNFLTDHRGMIILNHLQPGVYHITEVRALPGYILDETVHIVTITAGRQSVLEVVNHQMAGLRLHKIDSVTRQGIPGVEFRIFDFVTRQEVAGPFVTDNNGVIEFTGILPAGRYTIQETRAADGYLIDNMPRTIEFRVGMMTEVTWENTKEAGQIQITKLSSADNEMNALPRGSRLEGAVFEVRDWRTGNVIDQFRTDHRGVGVSRPLPLGRYLIEEIVAPAFFKRSTQVLDVTIEHSGQIVRMEFFNEPANVSVEARKTGPQEVMAGQPIVYTITRIANTSNIPLSDFYMRDVLPAHVVRLDRIFTGTFNQSVRYSVMFRTNLNDQWRVAYDNLSSTTNNALVMAPAALGLRSGEFVTEFMFAFGTVNAGFRNVIDARVEGTVLEGMPDGYQFVNLIDVGGRTGEEWVVGNGSWLVRVHRPGSRHPRTGW